MHKVIALQLTKTKNKKIKIFLFVRVGTIMNDIKLEISVSKCINCGIKINKIIEMLQLKDI